MRQTNETPRNRQCRKTPLKLLPLGIALGILAGCGGLFSSSVEAPRETVTEAPAYSVTPAGRVVPPVQNFRFLWITDTHIGAATGEENLRAVLADAARRVPDAVFILDSGDSTQYGYEEEWALYEKVAEDAPAPLFMTMGNHDTRWTEVGRQPVRERFGPVPRAITSGGVRFLLLNTGLLLEQYGHIERNAWEWAEKQMDDWTGPVVIAFHHPLYSTKKFIDGYGRFLERLAGRNVPLVLTGHIHSHLAVEANGALLLSAPAVMGKTAYYRVVEFRAATASEPARVEVFQYTVGKEEVVSVVRRDIAPEASQSLPPMQTRLELDALVVENTGIFGAEAGEVVPPLGREKIPEAGRKPGDPLVGPSGPNAWLDEDWPTTMTCLGGDRWAIAYPPHFPPGNHTVLLRGLDSEGRPLVRYAEFTLLAGADAGGRLQPETTAGPSWNVFAQLPAGIQARPLVHADRLVTVCNDGWVRCYERKTRIRVWSHRDGKDEVVSAPALSNGRVVYGSLRGAVVCLNMRNGKRVWESSVSGAVLATPLAAEDRIYIGTGGKTLEALDAETGQVLWTFPTKRLVKATSALHEGKLYFGAWDRTFYCVDAESGQLQWETELTTQTIFSPATCNPVVDDEGRILIVTHDYVTHCLDAATGKELWSAPDTDQSKPSYSTAVLHDGNAYLGSITGHMVGYRMSDGEPVLTLPVAPEGYYDALFDSAPILHNGRLYIGSVNGYAYAVDPAAGEVAWRLRLGPGFIFATPAVADDSALYFATLDGRIVEIQDQHQ